MMGTLAHTLDCKQILWFVQKRFLVSQPEQELWKPYVAARQFGFFWWGKMLQCSSLFYTSECVIGADKLKYICLPVLEQCNAYCRGANARRTKIRLCAPKYNIDWDSHCAHNMVTLLLSKGRRCTCTSCSRVSSSSEILLGTSLKAGRQEIIRWGRNDESACVGLHLPPITVLDYQNLSEQSIECLWAGSVVDIS